MANPTKLQKSPLVEAILDIRTITDSELPQEVFEKYYSEIASEFSVKTVNTLMEASVQMKVGEDAKFNSNSKPNGFVFKTSDNTKLVQFRRDGFTFNLVNSYRDWHSFSLEAKTHFDNYLKLIKPKLVTRIAVRCINLIQIPLPFGDFKEYILTVPEIAPGLPQQLSELFMRIVVPDSKKENIAIISEGIDLNRMKPDSALLPYIFDIDVFRLMNLEPDSELIWTMLDNIKNYRTEIFFKSITDKAINLFK